MTELHNHTIKLLISLFDQISRFQVSNPNDLFSTVIVFLQGFGTFVKAKERHRSAQGVLATEAHPALAPRGLRRANYVLKISGAILLALAGAHVTNDLGVIVGRALLIICALTAR